MSELSPRARAFLKAHRDDGAPTTEDAARVRSALKVVLYGTAAAGTAPIVARLGLVKAGLISTLVGAVTVTAVVAIQSRAPAPRPPPARPARTSGAAKPVVARVSTPPAADRPALEPAPVREPSSAPRRPVEAPAGFAGRSRQPAPPPAAQTTDLPPPGGAGPVSTPMDAAPPPPPPSPSSDEELRFIEEAQAALRRGDPLAALDALTRREEAFGETGGFAEEAQAARVHALCAAGRHAQAMAERARFLEGHPASLHRERIERACGGAK
jgi:hypothetical protein